ncbi:MAG: lysozyme inhibitor LprI family protein [Hungatella sp.]
MKNKSLWFVIVGIIAIGILITAYTNSFLKNQPIRESMSSEISIEEVPISIPDSSEKSSVMISPLETAAAILETETAAPERGRGRTLGSEETLNYRARLDELDVQIQRIRGEMTDPTAYALKTAAENEYKLWDSELNTIYNAVMKHLKEEEAVKLVSQERDWMKNRDAAAVEAAKKSNGGNLEGLEYTASLAASTRERAYELAMLYEQVTAR